MPIWFMGEVKEFISFNSSGNYSLSGVLFKGTASWVPYESFASLYFLQEMERPAEPHVSHGPRQNAALHVEFCLMGSL
jgi:hypothetical protein